MSTVANIPGYLTVEDAAAQLGVTPHRIRSLVRQGEIEMIRPSERMLLIDAVSFELYKRVAHAAGRPYSPEMAFGVLWLLSGRDPVWLDYHQKRRCVSALKMQDAEKLMRLCRKRARTIRLRMPASYFPVAAEFLVASGAGAIDAYDFDLTKRADVMEGYASEREYEDLVHECYAVSDPNGNLIVHVVEDLPENPGDMMPEAVVALDLAESLDARQHEVGIKKLKELLDARR